MNTDTLTYLMPYLQANELNTAMRVCQDWENAYHTYIQFRLRILKVPIKHSTTFLNTKSPVVRHALLMCLNRATHTHLLFEILPLLDILRQSKFAAFNEAKNDQQRAFFTSEAGILLMKQQWIPDIQTDGFYHIIYTSRLNERKQALLLHLFLNSAINTQTLLQFPRILTQLLSPKLAYALKKKLIQGEHLRLNNLKTCLTKNGFYLLRHKHITPEQFDEIPTKQLTYLSRDQARPLFSEALISLQYYTLMHPDPELQPYFTRKCWNHLLNQICQQIKTQNTHQLLSFLRSKKPSMHTLLKTKNIQSLITR